jgi:acetyl esterase/lipase
VSGTLAEDRSVFRRSWGQPNRSIRYGQYSDQILDEWVPQRGNGTTVVFFHGGFWDEAHDRRHCYPLASALRASGHRVLLPEYRRVRGAGGWPATIDDARAALSMALSLPGSDAVVLAGHSAGGQLALLLASTEPMAKVSHVVGLAPVASLTTAYQLGLGDGAVGRLLQGSPTEVHDRYALVDPSQALTPQAPVVLLHGSLDSLVPLSQSEDYVAAHPQTTLVQPDCGHFELIDPESTFFALVESALQPVRPLDD